MVHATRFASLLGTAAAIATLLSPGAALADDDKQAVYTITNSASGNQVLAFHRSAHGQLTPDGTFPTGGNGTGTGLGSGHSLVISRDGRTLAVVNAGSSTISTFRVEQ